MGSEPSWQRLATLESTALGLFPQAGARVIEGEIEPRLIIGRQRAAGDIARPVVQWIELQSFRQKRIRLRAPICLLQRAHQKISGVQVIGIRSQGKIEMLDSRFPLFALGVQFRQAMEAGPRHAEFQVALKKAAYASSSRPP